MIRVEVSIQSLSSWDKPGHERRLKRAILDAINDEAQGVDQAPSFEIVRIQFLGPKPKRAS